jgi:K+-sensing histidine kinase KdpD
MHLNEVILDGTDISKAIIDYATGNAITDIVVGASTRNTFIRYILINSPWLCHITFL